MEAQLSNGPGLLYIPDEDSNYLRHRARTQRPCVLLIDDDPDQLLIFETLLRKEGFHVVTSDTAERALTLMRTRFVDAVVCDILMPRMSGFEFSGRVRQLRTGRQNAIVPVILLTAADEDVELLALQSGADMFCEKRLAREQLGRQLRFLLEI